MNVHVANDSRGSVGGSWTFMDNLKKYAEFTISSEKDADIFLISGVTTIKKDTFRRLKSYKKPIVIRHDGVPEQHRNPRIRVGERLKNWSKEVSRVVYQSQFNRETVGRLIGVDGEVIYNGVDTDIFNTNGQEREVGITKCLFVYWREDPNKRPDEIVVRFRQKYQQDMGSKLIWLGKAPQYLEDTNFGFFNGENYVYLNRYHTHTELAQIMKKCNEIWFPSFADTAPNTLIEALHCGCKPKHINEYSGTKEYVDLYFQDYDLSAKRMANEYKKLFEKVLEHE